MNRYLYGVAHNVLQVFVSRNNDIDGYWGIGKLCDLARRRGAGSLSFDLLTDHALPCRTLEERVAEKFHVVLFQQPQRRRHHDTRLTLARLDISFRKDPQAPWGAPNYRYKCQLVLRDSAGREGEEAMSGSCWPHNPERESRRAGLGS